MHLVLGLYVNFIQLLVVLTSLLLADLEDVVKVDELIVDRVTEVDFDWRRAHLDHKLRLHQVLHIVFILQNFNVLAHLLSHLDQKSNLEVLQHAELL